MSYSKPIPNPLYSALNEKKPVQSRNSCTGRPAFEVTNVAFFEQRLRGGGESASGHTADFPTLVERIATIAGSIRSAAGALVYLFDSCGKRLSIMGEAMEIYNGADIGSQFDGKARIGATDLDGLVMRIYDERAES